MMDFVCVRQKQKRYRMSINTKLAFTYTYAVLQILIDEYPYIIFVNYRDYTKDLSLVELKTILDLSTPEAKMEGINSIITSFKRLM